LTSDLKLSIFSVRIMNGFSHLTRGLASSSRSEMEQMINLPQRTWGSRRYRHRREPGQFNTSAKHIAPEKRSGLERSAAWWLARAHAIGPYAGQWADSILEQRGVPAVRVVMGLVSLTRRHPAQAIEQACRVAVPHAAHRLRDIRNLLKRSEPAAEQQMLPFAEEHPVIRPLSEYGKLIQNAFDQTPVAKE
jgi:hypothetical protein